MTRKWRTIRVNQELAVAAERTLDKHYRTLSEFVSEAIQLRLDEAKQSHREIDRKQVQYPIMQERLLYSHNHIWTMVTPEGNVTVGLSDYAQRHLKGIASIQVDPVGGEVKKDEPFGVVETWMFMFDLYSPVSGKIVRINEVLQDEPFNINNNPYETTWIAEIKPSNLIKLEEELRCLMRLSQYKLWVPELGRSRSLGT